MLTIPGVNTAFAGGTFECMTAGAGHFNPDNRCQVESSSITCTSDSAPIFSDDTSCNNLSVADCTKGNPHSCHQYSLSCEWANLQNPSSPYNGRPSFCIGGLPSINAAQQLKAQFYCADTPDGWCGGIIWPRNKQDYNLSNTAEFATDETGRYFTCLTGDYDKSVEDALRALVRGKCVFMGLIVGTGGLVLGGPVIGAVTGGATCLHYLNEQDASRPAIVGQVVDASGNLLCKGDMQIRLKLDHVEPIPGTINGSAPPPIRNVCSSIPGEEGDFDKQNTRRGQCATCFNNGGAWTAIGCIESDPKLFVGRILGFAIGVAGGIAFLMILFGGFQILTSSGDPEHMNAGRELIAAAITGLLFIVFSLFILRVIGVSILGLPGFK